MDFDAGALDKVLKQTLEVMESSKYQIFEIAESARAEILVMKTELQNIMEDINETIEKVDKLELEFKRSRVRLSEVSRDFKKFSEEDIHSAYENATLVQLDVMFYREKEKNLKVRREELHKRIRNIERTVERAETVASQMNVVSEYLSGDFTQVTRIIESAKNRQLLGLKIILAQEEERKRIAREIHDGLAQSMANVVLRTEITEKMLDKKKYDTVKDEIVDLKSQLRIGLEDIRKMIFNLRPMTLDDLGLVPTLRKFVQDFEDRFKINTNFELHGKDSRLPSAIEVAVYRFVQEAFTNAQKHANASYISLSLEMISQQKIVKITVQDNGKGFDIDRIGTKMIEGSHFGLLGMKERIELLEGRLEIESKEHEGTKITMIVPIKIENAEEVDS